jgi:hypothetical protein
MRDDATGKTFNYMHLDPKLWDEKEKHLNKKNIKRRLDT